MIIYQRIKISSSNNNNKQYRLIIFENEFLLIEKRNEQNINMLV